MKKTLFLFATAAIALASCSSDDTIAENMGLNAANEISFRTFVAGATRAVDVTTDNLNGFKAYATKTSGGAVYFGEEVFTKQTDNTYTSTNKHYWPADGALDFFAYAPSGTNTQLTGHTDNSLTFTVTPSTTVSEQVDLVVANTDNKTKGGTYDPNDVYNTASGTQTSKYGANGIPLNFRHAESKIVVKFKNGQANLKMDVQAFKIVNVDGSATFTFANAGDDANTDTQDSRQLAGGWTGNADGFNAVYTVTPTTANTIAASKTTAVYLQNGGTPSTDANANAEMILIPQETTTSYVYAGSDVNSLFPAGKTYIAVKMQIKNNDATGTVIADATTDGKWAIWPVAFTWTPGMKYTYIVDLGDGGYWEKKVEADNETSLDPVLEGAEIKFVTVTVDNWGDGGNTTIGNMTFVKGGTYTENIANAAGTYNITVTGLTVGSTVSVNGTVNCTSPTVLPETVGASGSVTITCPVAAGTSATSVITLTETGSPGSTTTIKLVQP